jgi:hypothetical protein
MRGIAAFNGHIFHRVCIEDQDNVNLSLYLPCKHMRVYHCNPPNFFVVQPLFIHILLRKY